MTKNKHQHSSGGFFEDNDFNGGGLKPFQKKGMLRKSICTCVYQLFYMYIIYVIVHCSLRSVVVIRALHNYR